MVAALRDIERSLGAQLALLVDRVDALAAPLPGRPGALPALRIL